MNDVAVNMSQLDIGRLIDERPMASLQVLVAVLCALAMFVGGYDIQVMALTVPSLAQQWHLPPSSFGAALSSNLVGIVVGGAVLAPLGDRFGRRRVMIGGLVFMGLATALTALAASPDQFTFWRFLTGVGAGVIVPNCNAWTSEYAPLRRRSLVVVLMNAAIGIGAFSAGLIAPPVLAHAGWRGTFLIGGLSPLALGLAFALAAPESLKFLVARRPRDPRIGSILRRIAPGVDPAQLRHAPPAGPVPRRSVVELLSPTYRARSLLLWVTCALNLFIMYVLISWLPTLLQSAGWASSAALQGAVLIQAGGVCGGILLSFLLDRGLALPALRAAFLIAAGCLLLFLVTPSGALWALLLLLVGGGISGAQLALNALSTAYYPPAIKATGMGWVGVLGNGGAILAPLAGAWIINRGIATVHILALLAFPALLCCGFVLLMRREWQAH